MRDVVVAGVGIHPFGRFEAGYRELGAHAVRGALADAGVGIGEVDIALVGNVGAEMAKGQNVLDLVGRTARPIINVESACASSASTLYLGATMVEHGAADIVLCLGVEKAPRGFVAASGYEAWQIETGLGVNPVYFALAAQELLATTDATVDDLAAVSVKNHRHAVHNANAMYRKEVTAEEVLASRPVCPPLTLLMLTAPNEGAAAAVLMSRAEAARRGVEDPVLLRAVSLSSRGDSRLVRPRRRRLAAGPGEPDRASCGGRPTRRRASDPRSSTSSSARTPTPPRSCWPTGTSVCASRATRPATSAAARRAWAVGSP